LSATNDGVILGLNAFHGDSSAALLSGGDLLAAVEEERFNRVKHWAGLPILAAKSCLNMAGADAIGHIAVSRDPRARLISKAIRVLIHPRLWRYSVGRASNSLRVTSLKQQLLGAGVAGIDAAQLHFVEHHRAHLASAFFASPFAEAALLSVDGFGDFTSVMWATGRDSRMNVHGSVRFPHSLGLYYTAFTQLLGFRNYGDEYKMMGLAAYGKPRYAARIRDVVSTQGDQVRLNLKYFRHHNEGVEMIWDGGEPILGRIYSPLLESEFGPARQPDAELLERHADMAASAQAVLEENYFTLLNFAQGASRQKAVCLAGGVALNCVANGMIFERTGFRDVYVQPAAHDAGTSIGAALYVWHQILHQPRRFVMRHVHYGTHTADHEIRKAIDATEVNFHRLNERELVKRTAELIANGNVVGWYQGRMEFGPRALGNRSILADPRSRAMKDILNRRIKFREPFRPFCPSILAERAGEYFETAYPSPFMVVAYKIRPEKRDVIPAVTHEDGTGRLQTVDRDVNPLYWSLIREFADLTGVPVLLNTSFNENEPIVDTPQQALDCFLRTRMDVLVLGSYLMLKSENEALSATRQQLVGKLR
jgi:carbamoyltransferase